MHPLSQCFAHLPPCSPALDDMLSPEELSSFVLAHLKRQAEAALGESVTGAVSLLQCFSSPFVPFLLLWLPCIHTANSCPPGTLSPTCNASPHSTFSCPNFLQVVTVPAHFNQAQQGATHNAAQQAGIATVQLLQVGRCGLARWCRSGRPLLTAIASSCGIPQPTNFKCHYPLLPSACRSLWRQRWPTASTAARMATQCWWWTWGAAHSTSGGKPQQNDAMQIAGPYSQQVGAAIAHCSGVTAAADQPCCACTPPPTQRASSL